MPSKQIFIGTMSGTSLDGLDVCAVEFNDTTFHIHAAETFEFSTAWRSRLNEAFSLSGIELQQLNVDYGIYCGECINMFVAKYKLNVAYIASHGQTIFHTPHTGLTLQIGSGAHIAAITGISTICDFRSLDVAMGGQGAPLVPIGDQFLFGNYHYCLNIGGFANVSMQHDGRRIAWDICAANIVLNDYAQKYGCAYDDNGNLGRKGNCNQQLLNSLNQLAFYAQAAPKSLGREWVEREIMPLLQASNCSDFDSMRTYYEHCGYQIGNTLRNKNTQTLCSGGGVCNSLLMEIIQHYAESKLIIPTLEIIHFKEALIFAYLGYLRVQHKPNCLASVTGAAKNVCGGVIWQV
ncbi:MAG: anhydro-N-acetylmuramic acid kinase [Bacteroidales bacterium]|jgi:anhydro-N-acetylmuramic acid kinase|nr:anhydro-N-acetylmuramic acid kinase [Bacteroidales bacterium]